MATPADIPELTERTRAFVRDVCIPAEARHTGRDLDPALRAELQAAARAAGVFAPHVPRALGGLGLAIGSWAPVFEAAGYSLLGPQALNCAAPDEGNMHMLELIATEEQKARYLAPLARGDVRSCFAMTEPHPGAGSDPAALATTARRAGDRWVIDGDKRFISGADGAAFAICMARAPEGATMFLVDAGNPGFEVGRHMEATDTVFAGGHCEVRFRDCVVEADAVLGEVGEGFRYAQVRLGPARLTHCMRWLGLARRALDIALDRAAEREVFGGRLEELGLAQGHIADSVLDLDASRALIRTAAEALDAGLPASQETSVAKVFVSEAAFRVIDRAMQLAGGDGVTTDLPLARFLAEVRPFRIYDGPSETHRWAIARRASRGRARERAAEAARAQRDERHIAFVGFMGAGKTSVGRSVAERLGRPFLDTDDVVEERSGRSIADFFRAGEEAAFRALEAEAVRDVVERPPMVLALGGGALEDPATRALLLERALVVHLVVSWPQLSAALPGLADGRPLLRGRSEEEIRALYERRQASYRAAHLQVEAPRGEVAAAAEQVLTPGRVCDPVTEPSRSPRFRRDEPVTRMLLLGPPGGGKGTQGIRLRDRLGVRHLATGDLLRAEMAGDTEAGRRAAAFVERGELVPDEHVLALLEPTLLESAESGGYILDGFPRTVAQAEALDTLAERHGIALQIVISLDVPETELQRRLLERAGEQGRSDDTPDVIAHRLEVFASETAPLLDFYERKGILARIDGDQDVDAITREILERVGTAARTT